MCAVQFRVINEHVFEAPGDPQQAMQMDRNEPQHETHGIWRAYYRLTDINSQLTPYVEDVVRSEVPRKVLSSLETKQSLHLLYATYLILRCRLWTKLTNRRRRWPSLSKRLCSTR